MRYNFIKHLPSRPTCAILRMRQRQANWTGSHKSRNRLMHEFNEARPIFKRNSWKLFSVEFQPRALICCRKTRK